MPDLTGLNRGQREGILLLERDLAVRKDLSEQAKQDLLLDRLATYQERNREHTRESRGRVRSPLAPVAPARFSLLCIDCGWDIAPSSPKPRIPLCKRCHDSREHKKQAKRRARLADAAPRRRRGYGAAS
jgi:hypothetical protein